MSINVIYEDNHVIVVEKPVNVPSQADSSEDSDMLSQVKQYVKEKYNKPGEVFIGLVHRLDRPTGGLMVFARNSKAAARLSEQIRLGALEKTYLAVLMGTPAKHKDTLVDYLLKDPFTNMVRISSQAVEGAKEAVLDYEVIGQARGLSLAKVRLHTGRAHQIRVQMANIGTPLYGDMRYGKAQDGQTLRKAQLALYSVKLSFEHPTRKERLTFVCYPPKVSPWTLFDFRLD